MSYVIALAWPLVALVALGLVAVGLWRLGWISEWERKQQGQWADHVIAHAKLEAHFKALEGALVTLDGTTTARIEKLETVLKTSPPPADKHTAASLARFR